MNVKAAFLSLIKKEQNKNKVESPMKKVGKGKQGLPKPVLQPVETSQTIPNSEKTSIFPKLPYGLPISREEFCVLKDKVYQNSTLHPHRAKSRKNKVTQDES